MRDRTKKRKTGWMAQHNYPDKFASQIARRRKANNVARASRRRNR